MEIKTGIAVRIFGMILCLALVQTASAQVDTSVHYYTSFDGTKIYYEVNGNGYPVILVHGFITNGESWKRTAVYKDLQQNGFEVITMDLRGNGKSDKPHTDTAYANDAEAKDIMGLATSLGLKRYDVVGYSRGSIITARLLVLDNRIHKAVIGGMGTDFTNPQWPRRIMFYKALSGDTSITELQPVVHNIQKAGLDQSALALMQKEQPSTPVAALKQVKQPVLVVCGSEDDDKEKAADLAKIFPHAGFALVPGDHGAAVATKQFSEKVIPFLSGKK